MSDTPSTQATSAPIGFDYNPEGLTVAADTLDRIRAILTLKLDNGVAGAKPSQGVWYSQLSPAQRDALHGELRLLQMQLYSTGLFERIDLVQLR